MKKIITGLTIIGVILLFGAFLFATYFSFSMRNHLISDAQRNEIMIDLLKSS